MTKLLTTTALALLLGTGFALAAEEPGQPAQPEQDLSVQDGQPATESTVAPDTAEEAKIPDEGEPDTSGGAKERSSAPPDSGAVIGEDTGDDASDDDAMSGAKKSQAQPEDESDTSME